MSVQTDNKKSVKNYNTISKFLEIKTEKCVVLYNYHRPGNNRSSGHDQERER